MFVASQQLVDQRSNGPKSREMFNRGGFEVLDSGQSGSRIWTPARSGLAFGESYVTFLLLAKFIPNNSKTHCRLQPTLARKRLQARPQSPAHEGIASSDRW